MNFIKAIVCISVVITLSACGKNETAQTHIAKAETLSGVAKELGITMPQLAISWCLKNDDVSTVILGASKLDQLKENIKSQDYVELLTDEVMESIEDILGNKPKHPPF